MEMQKVLVARVKGGIGDAEAMTRYILNGLSCGVLVLPDEVISYSVEDLPVLYETPSNFTKALAEAGALDAEKYIGKPPAEESAPGLPTVEVVPLAKEESSESNSVDNKIVNVLGSLLYPKKEETPEADKPQEPKETEDAQDAEAETAPGNFKPVGKNTAIKRETYARLAQYKDRTGLRWAQRVSEATGGRVSPDVIRFGLLEARDIGIDRWKLIAKALDKLEEEMEK